MIKRKTWKNCIIKFLIDKMKDSDLKLFFKSELYLRYNSDLDSVVSIFIRNKFNNNKYLFKFKTCFSVLLIIVYPFLLLLRLLFDLFSVAFAARKDIVCKRVYLVLFNVYYKKKFTLALDDDFNNSICMFDSKDSFKDRFVSESMSGFFSLKDVISVYYSSILTYVVLFRRLNVLDVPYVYKALRFYKIGTFLDKMDSTNKLFFCNERDEYCALIDRPASFEKIMIQHGTASRYLPMTYRYSTIDKLYTSDRGCLDLYLRNYFKVYPVIYDFKRQIDLVDLEMDTPAVLLISYSKAYSGEEIEIIKYFQSLRRYRLYVKLHPSAISGRYDSYSSKYITIIKDCVYPNVEYVISYRSHLAREYENLGITVFYHTDFMCIKDLLAKLSN